MVVLIVDMGSQYTHVIWRTCRELGFEGKIVQKENFTYNKKWGLKINVENKQLLEFMEGY